MNKIFINIENINIYYDKMVMKLLCIEMIISFSRMRFTECYLRNALSMLSVSLRAMLKNDKEIIQIYPFNIRGNP